ncbi:MAG: prephenate dehydrogenase/arogenate dehydrogenase family protein [Actinomycetota bacterium]
MSDPELTRLRAEIEAIDRSLLDALNRRFELVRTVAEHKAETGAPAIDAQREAELLAQLAAANRGPLSEQAVRTAFSALLDVMKSDLRPRRAMAETPAKGVRHQAVSSLAVVGTGLLGTSVARAAQRAGVARVVGLDEDAERLRQSAVEPASSLDGVELVLVAVPVGALPDAVRDVLDRVGPETTVTDVGSTKRGVAAIDDPRFVPGHPLAGGATGGPGRASADLFDRATWILTPTPASGADHVRRVEQFVTSIGAHAARLDPETHDRVLALTSHLPHVVANLLVQHVTDEAVGFAGAALREMTRVAGANASVWADIFLENADEVAGSLRAHADASGEIVDALERRDRDALERWIEQAAATRTRLEEAAYRTDAKQLHRIRVRVPDKPGVLARITQTLGAAGINIEDFELRHVSPEYGGVLVLLVTGSENLELARTLLRREGYAAA